ncbi:hypothetical protein ACFU5O_19155 [Streptomyces sp. NPDC057445]|uniref:hypothetical protein n=1 Tax=Streptomyces sp. NPDC057445 TaxID=3346136 RepID=UPI003683C89B
MRRINVRRTVAAASAVSLALLVGACGSGDPAAKDEPKGGAGTPKESAAKALTQAELDKLILAESDLKDHKIAKANEADIATAKTATSDKAECKPLVDAMALRAAGTPGATASRKIVAIPKAPGADASPEDKAKAGLAALSATVTADTLGSYDGQGAQDAFAAFKKAGEDCAGGFTLVTGTEKTKFTKIETAAFTGGDEAVAFTLTMDLEGDAGTTQLVAVRKGGTLATFHALSLAGKAEQPKAVVDAQLKKLG